MHVQCTLYAIGCTVHPIVHSVHMHTSRWCARQYMNICIFYLFALFAHFASLTGRMQREASILHWPRHIFCLFEAELSVAAPLSFPRSSQAIHQEQAEKFSQEEKLGIGHFSDRTLYNGNKDPVIGHFAFVAYVVAFVFRWLLDQVESWFIMCKFSK